MAFEQLFTAEFTKFQQISNSSNLLYKPLMIIPSAQRSGLLIRRSVYISKSQRIFACHFLGQILVCVYAISQYDQILISCTIPSGSPFPPSLKLVLYSLCAILLHLFITRLTVLYLSPLNLLLYCSLWVFHTSIIWWFFTGVWLIASLLKSPELFSVFWPISTML